MADEEKKEKLFSLRHIFTTVVIAGLTTMLVGPMIEYNWTHFSEIGQALSQIGNYLLMPVFNAMAPAVMPFLDPIREGLGIIAPFAGQTADGAQIIKDTADSVSSGVGVIPGFEN